MTAIVAGVAPVLAMVDSSVLASTRFCGCGKPCAKIVDSNATTADFAVSAACTSTENCIGLGWYHKDPGTTCAAFTLGQMVGASGLDRRGDLVVEVAMSNMFEAYAAARHCGSRFSFWLLSVVMIGHILTVSAVWAKAQWQIDRLLLPPQAIFVGQVPPPPSGAAPPPGGQKPTTASSVRKVVRHVIQPASVAPVSPSLADRVSLGANDLPNVAVGECDPTLGRCDGSDPNGAGAAADQVVEEPSASVPDVIVTPVAAKANFLAGNTQPQPDGLTAVEMVRSGKSAVTAVVKLCIAVDGQVANVNLMKSSGFPGYDRRIENAVAGWTYRPFSVNGRASQVCTTVQFIYKP